MKRILAAIAVIIGMSTVGALAGGGNDNAALLKILEQKHNTVPTKEQIDSLNGDVMDFEGYFDQIKNNEVLPIKIINEDGAKLHGYKGSYQFKQGKNYVVGFHFGCHLCRIGCAQIIGGCIDFE